MSRGGTLALLGVLYGQHSPVALQGCLIGCRSTHRVCIPRTSAGLVLSLSSRRSIAVSQRSVKTFEGGQEAVRPVSDRPLSYRSVRDRPVCRRPFAGVVFWEPYCNSVVSEPRPSLRLAKRWIGKRPTPTHSGGRKERPIRQRSGNLRGAVWRKGPELQRGVSRSAKAAVHWTARSLIATTEIPKVRTHRSQMSVVRHELKLADERDMAQRSPVADRLIPPQVGPTEARP